jgi:hypothetical protein
MIFRNLLLVFCVVLFLQSCGPTRFVEPLKARQNAVSIDLGGPLIKVPGVASIPIPFTSITYGRGLTNRLTLHGSWYSTAAFFGVAQLGAGGTYGLWKSKNKKHGASAMLGFNTALDVYESNLKFWPQLDAHYYFKYNLHRQSQDDLLTNEGKQANLLYAGIGTWYELSGTKGHNQKQTTRVIPMLNIGHDLNWGKWSFKTELKLIAPFSNNEHVVVDYISLTGNKGATGIYLGITRKF